MINKIKKFMDQPMTWGGMLKLMFWSTVASIVYSVMVWAWMFGWFAKVIDGINGFLKKFTKKTEPVEEQ